MVHYVLLKLAKDVDADSVERKVRGVYEELAKTLDYLNDPVTYRCCVDRDSNADIMSVVRLDSADCLQPYLEHPLHVQMAQVLKDAVVGRMSFDRNE